MKSLFGLAELIQPDLIHAIREIEVLASLSLRRNFALIISEAHSDEALVVLQLVDLRLEVFEASEVGLGERWCIVHRKVCMDDWVYSEGLTCLLLAAFLFVFEKKEAAGAQDGESVLEQDLTFLGLGAVFDFDGPLENFLFFRVDLSRAQICLAECDCFDIV